MHQIAVTPPASPSQPDFPGPPQLGSANRRSTSRRRAIGCLAAARFAAAIVLSLAVAFLLDRNVPAGAAPPATYSVQDGDTLYGIAAKLGISEGDRMSWIGSVLLANGLASPESLQAGQTLTLPDLVSLGSGGANTGPAAKGPTAALQKPASTDSYTVQTGDTLAGIAARLGVSAADFPGWIGAVTGLSGLASPDVLMAGQSLTLPSLPAAKQSAGAAGDTSAATAAPASTISYTVQPGDTLSAIAAKLGVSEADRPGWVGKVLRLSGLSDADLLLAGQSLTLPSLGPSASTANAGGASVSTAAPGTLPAAAPAPAAKTLAYTVQAGDTLSTIAAKLGVADPDVAGWLRNVAGLSALANPDALVVGQALSLPILAGQTAATVTGAGVSGPTGSAGATNAVAPSPSAAPPVTVTYTVQAGDTLSTIAGKRGVSDVDLAAWLKNVVQLSQLANPDLLVAGQSLSLPVLPASAQTAVSTGVATTPPPLPIAGGPTYSVQPGDTLKGMAIKLGIAEADQSTWAAAVIQLNGLVNPDALAVGLLTLPASPAPTSASTIGAGPSLFAPAPVAVSPLFQGGGLYTVKPGDSLQGIAQKLGIPAENQAFWMAEVTSLNGISATALPVGDALRLP